MGIGSCEVWVFAGDAGGCDGAVEDDEDCFECGDEFSDRAGKGAGAVGELLFGACYVGACLLDERGCWESV